MTDQNSRTTSVIPVVNSLSSTRNVQHLKELFGDERGGYILSAIISMAASNRDLHECNPRSVLSAALQAINLGLSISPAMGHCSFPAYNDKASGEKVCVMQIQWRGYAHLAISGGLTDFDVQPAVAGEVKKFDRVRRTIEFDEGVVESKPEFIPNAGKSAKWEKAANITEAIERAKPFVGAWAYVTTKSVTKWHYTTIEDAVKRAQVYSPSYDSRKQAFSSNSFWITNIVPMTMKTAFLALKQFLPYSDNLRKAMEVDTDNLQKIEQQHDSESPVVITQDEPTTQPDNATLDAEVLAADAKAAQHKRDKAALYGEAA